jgi:competence protein ComEA
MTTDTEVAPGPVARTRAVLRPVRGELLGLAVFLAGALLATGVFVAQALGRPAPVPDMLASGAHDHLGAGEVGAAIDAYGAADGDAAGVDEVGSGTGADAHGAAIDDDPAQAGGDGPGDADGAADEPTEVVVHVSGAVAAPGVVVVPAGARLADAVAAAGGLLDDALPERVNLARLVVDGEQVHVPHEGDEDLPPIGADQPDAAGSAGGGDPSGASGGAGGGAPDGAGGGRVDLNHASAAELETLPGIGPAKAAAIVRHRDEHGPFAAPGDLRDVTGIGEATFQGLAELVTVG